MKFYNDNKYMKVKHLIHVLTGVLSHFIS